MNKPDSMVEIEKQYRCIMGSENQVFEQALVMFPEETSDRWQKVADHVNGRQLDRCQVSDPENGREPCQLNLQVLWPPMTSRSTVRLGRPPTMFETITPGRGVQMKKQKLEVVTGELNAQFERLFSMRGSTPSYTTNRDDIDEFSSKYNRTF
ncbi:uncharacterized protein LOC117932666 [Vitis riparia]|uniref:uncharacterized protein LOC117932666 n=1 Tax=Vitis riparia TaxID=96939 RepID=UPI00155A5756|nr:uncharacterized protein LOC117932666 [Vitis riparia]